MTKKFKRRDLILEKASQLFTHKGFSATTLADIAEAVGIKRESLYYYYPGRYDLLYDIIVPQITQVTANFEQIVAEEEYTEQAIRRGITNHLQHFNPSYLHMAMAVRKNSRDEVQAKFIHLRNMFKAYENIWIDVIREGGAKGHIQSSTPPRILVYSILGLCNSLSSWYRPDGALSLDHIARHYGDMILNGITP